jgi:hypothetical protein
MTDNSLCIPCEPKTTNKCPHGKRKYDCIDCGGKGICEHKKHKYNCNICGNRCNHNKKKSRCVECSGSAICEHKKRKDNCKDCSGSGICQHKKQKSHCNLCSGCEHGFIKLSCKSCNSCQHGNIKYYCKECGGSGICEHSNRKDVCKECKGSAICIHNKNKTYCKECNGSMICIHRKCKKSCTICHNGSAFCIHDKWKTLCKICDGRRLCKSSWCEVLGALKYKGFCLNCFIHLFPDEPNTHNYKTKEKDVVDRITQTFNNFTWVADKKVQDGCSRRRPDILLDMGSHIIIIEVDENKHTDYDCSCEHKRLMELSQDLQHRPIIFIRFNPDDYTNQEGVLVKSCWKLNKLGVMQITKTKQKEWEERIEALKQQIQYWIDNPTEKTIEIVELFY